MFLHVASPASAKRTAYRRPTTPYAHSLRMHASPCLPRGLIRFWHGASSARTRAYHGAGDVRYTVPHCQTRTVLSRRQGRCRMRQQGGPRPGQPPLGKSLGRQVIHSLAYGTTRESGCNSTVRVLNLDNPRVLVYERRVISLLGRSEYG